MMDMPSIAHDHKHEQPAIGTHGMVVVGEETIYLSHLPMWMFPHTFQVILQVTFTGTNQPQARYVEDRQTTGTKLYTLSPERFDLRDFAPTGPQHLPRRSSFKATVWRNHFEEPPTHPGEKQEIGEADVNIENVVYFQELHPQGPELQNLEYVLFGKGQELFLAHVISKPPDFDQIVSIKVGDHQLTDEDLRQGVLVTFPERTNSIQNKIKEGERLSGTVRPFTRGASDLQIEANIEFYFETEDLAASMI
jgi:hypothetical protein